MVQFFYSHGSCVVNAIVGQLNRCLLSSQNLVISIVPVNA